MQLSVLRPLLAVLAILSVFTLRAGAQGAGDDAPPRFSVSFRSMGWTGAAKDLYILQGETRKSFTATDANPSRRVDYRGPSPLFIYKEGETMLNAEGLPVPRPVARFEIEESGDWLIILEASKDSSGRLVYEVFPVVDDPGEIEEGYRVVNFTGAPLAIQMNDSRSLVAPRDFKHLSPTARDDFSLSVLIAAQSEGEWKLEYENLFRNRPGIRTTLFVFKTRDRIRTRRFTDRATPDEP